MGKRKERKEHRYSQKGREKVKYCDTSGYDM